LWLFVRHLIFVPVDGEPITGVGGRAGKRHLDGDVTVDVVPVTRGGVAINSPANR